MDKMLLEQKNKSIANATEQAAFFRRNSIAKFDEDTMKNLESSVVSKINEIYSIKEQLSKRNSKVVTWILLRTLFALIAAVTLIVTFTSFTNLMVLIGIVLTGIPSYAAIKAHDHIDYLRTNALALSKEEIRLKQDKLNLEDAMRYITGYGIGDSRRSFDIQKIVEEYRVGKHEVLQPVRDYEKSGMGKASPNNDNIPVDYRVK